MRKVYHEKKRKKRPLKYIKLTLNKTKKSFYGVSVYVIKEGRKKMYTKEKNHLTG